MGSDNWMNSHFACAHRVKIDLFRRYGAIAAAGDRHLAEFTAPRYTRDPETIRRWTNGIEFSMAAVFVVVLTDQIRDFAKRIFHRG